MGEIAVAPLHDISYARGMANKGLWTTKRDERVKELLRIREALIRGLAKDQYGFGPLSHGDIALVLGTTQSTVSRRLKRGSRIVAAS